MGASIGIAGKASGTARLPGDMFRNADVAMYAAKRSEKD